MRQLTEQSCPRCEYPIERNYLRCPECQHRLKDPCVLLQPPVDPRWAICPYCETPLRHEREEEAPRKRTALTELVGRAGRRRRRRRRPRASTSTRRAKPAPASRSATPASDAAARTKRSERPQRAERPPPASRRSTTATPARAGARPRLPEPRDRIRPRDPRGPQMSEKTRTLILVKPDAFERGLTGEVLARFERKGLRADRAEADHRRRGDRQRALRRAHREALLRRARLLHHRRTAGRRCPRGRRGRHGGPPADRRDQPGRGRPRLDPRRLRLEVTFNMVHGSDSDESAEREIGIWFPELG